MKVSMMPMMRGVIQCKNGNIPSFSQLSPTTVSFVRALPTTRNSTIGKQVLPCTNTQTNWGRVAGSCLLAIQSYSSNQNGNHCEKPNRLHRNCVLSRWFSNDGKTVTVILLASPLLSITNERGDKTQ